MLALKLAPEDGLMLYNAACLYASLGDATAAILALRGAIESGHRHYDQIKRDPDLDPIRDEPGYLELMRGH
jgi:hypothetical protein